MADRYIDHDETEIYGAYAADKIRDRVQGLIAEYDTALEYVATELTDATKAVQTAVADARAADAKIRTGSHARSSVFKRATAVSPRSSAPRRRRRRSAAGTVRSARAARAALGPRDLRGWQGFLQTWHLGSPDEQEAMPRCPAPQRWRGRVSQACSSAASSWFVASVGRNPPGCNTRGPVKKDSTRTTTAHVRVTAAYSTTTAELPYALVIR